MHHCTCSCCWVCDSPAKQCGILLQHWRCLYALFNSIAIFLMHICLYLLCNIFMLHAFFTRFYRRMPTQSRVRANCFRFSNTTRQLASTHVKYIKYVGMRPQRPAANICNAAMYSWLIALCAIVTNLLNFVCHCCFECCNCCCCYCCWLCSRCGYCCWKWSNRRLSHRSLSRPHFVQSPGDKSNIRKRLRYAYQRSLFLTLHCTEFLFSLFAIK